MTAEDQEFFLRSLEDLEAERAAGDISEDDYEQLKARYVAQAARAIRHDDGADEPANDGAGTLRRPRRVTRLTATVLVVALVAGMAGWGVAASSGDRLPGQSVTGDIELTSADLLARARVQQGEGKVLDAIKTYDKVIELDPANAEALTYRGWLLRLAGLPEEGLAYIDRAIKADPDYPDARVFRGVILLEDMDRPAEAAVELRRFLASDPPADMVPLVQEVLDRAERG